LLRIAHSDWDPSAEVEPRAVRIAPFELDAHEVTLDRWQRCVAAGGCRGHPVTEPGQPVTGITPAEALQFCRFFGGRLPTADEWLFAAASPKNRRFPWGETGLVCRRAVFGLAEGPCAEGGSTPEVVGSRPDGRTPEGVFDMAGNVAEWTLELPSKQSQGRPEFAARGGSFRSKVATELKSWSAEMTERPAPHIGFRCAYSSG
ncbi:MAG TPA: SUMF1/EgtB/PvdO family nonheme iron enzyme, partial [Polyangiaceae bacterium]|nr:SUMF1/EgtB/PvdO family nonheme iron enzyme [Polyangiaceae bacterium]